MIGIPGYKIKTLLHESARTRVYRAARESDGTPVIAKVLRDEFPSIRDLARFQLGHDIGQSIRSEHVIAHFGAVPIENGLAVLTEDYGAVSLDRIRMEDRTTAALLQIVLAVLDGLADVHRARVIHKDLKPSNIVMNPATGQVKIIDFGISTRLERESPVAGAPENIEGSLAYISPEQTGRMNRSVDFRSDFYALGIMLYELLTGDVPFRSDDAMKLIHSHLALPLPPMVSETREIPPALAAIVGRLTAKNAEDRYQSIHGIRYDLAWVLDHLQSGVSQEAFTVASRDVSDRFQLPQAIYGRQVETHQLLEAFRRVGSERRVFLNVSGYSGIGKSALISEIHKPIVEHSGWFCTGKFDQFRRDLPYVALIDALRDLVRQLLRKEDAVLAGYRTAMEAAVGANGRLMADVVPELEMLLGPQPPVQPLGAAEAQNRFNRVFTRFLAVFAQAPHPLTIFLDDLQWADVPSLELLTAMMTDHDLAHLLLIGAYRDNETSPTHPLIETLGRIQKSGQRVDFIHLPPLDERSVVRFVADATRSTPEKALPLGRLIKQKTDGNPFFVGEFLRTLHARELIRFDTATASWSWDLDEVVRLDITGNVVELLAGKLRDLPPEVLDMLQFASCIGSRFDLRMLALVLDRDLEQTTQLLDHALLAGFVVPLDDSYKYMKAVAEFGRRRGAQAPGTEGEPANAWYRFLHDRVQQAANSLLDDAQRAHRHLRIGRVLDQKTAPARREELIIDIANHFEQALSLLTGEQERAAVARVELEAGRRARASLAFAPAVRYFRAAIGLMPADSWNSQYDLTLKAKLDCADVLQLSGDFDQAEVVLADILAHARTVLDAVPAHSIRIESKQAQKDPNGSLDIGVQVLGELGLELPRRPTKLQVYWELARTKWYIGRRSPAQLVELPAMSDPRLLAVMDILRSNASSAYFTSADLFVMVVFKTVQVAVKHGNSTHAAYGYALYAIFLCGALKDMDGGHEFGALSFKVLERHPSPSLTGKLTFIWGAFVAPWKDPFPQCARFLFEGWRPAVDGGDLEYAAYSILHGLVLRILGGMPLEETHSQYRDHVEWVRTSKQAQTITLLDSWYQMLQNLREHGRLCSRLEGPSFDMDQRLPELQARNDQISIAYSAVADGMLACLMGNYVRARRHLDLAEKHIDQLFSSVIIGALRFYSAVTECGLERPISSPTRVQDGVRVPRLKELDRCLRELTTYARFNPGAFQHKVSLLEAERAKLKGRLEAADLKYRRAIAEAAASGFLQDEALAWELRARAWLEREEPNVARIFMARARDRYQQWGAATKVIEIDATHGELLKPPPEDATMAISISRTTSGDKGRTTSGVASAWLELSAILRASQAISEQTTLAGALRILLSVILEHCGAQRGFLVGGSEERLAVQARAWAGADVEIPPAETPLDPDELSLDIVRFVTRSRNEVVLDDACVSEMFASDPYIQRRRPRSVLCLPLVRQDEMVGILYLENNMAVGTFTQAALDTVRVLATQAAITLENARLFEAQIETGAQLRKSLGEKEALLREIHHRVKNNLQVISSLLALQGRGLADPEARRTFEESRGRIHSMALIHDHLYSESSTAFDRIDMRAYLDRLTREIQRSQIGDARKIEIRIQVEDLVLPLELAVPCGLIVNELVTNSLKYAFPGRAAGSIILGGSRDESGLVTLRVADDGVGMKPGGDLEKSGTLGLKLITTLTRQIRGQLQMISEGGTATIITFRPPAPRTS